MQIGEERVQIAIETCRRKGDFDDQVPTGFRSCNDFPHSRLFVVGAQTPQFQVDYQTPTTGVALPLHTRQPLLINSHYTNPFKDTLAEVMLIAGRLDDA